MAFITVLPHVSFIFAVSKCLSFKIYSEFCKVPAVQYKSVLGMVKRKSEKIQQCVSSHAEPSSNNFFGVFFFF